MSAKPMKKTDVVPEYDLGSKKVVRGKYAKLVRTGFSVKKFDGSNLVSDKYFAAIAPDVREYFPDSKSINVALRKLITLIPKKTYR